MVDLKIVALAGGVGGAKLVDGLAQVLHPKQLTVIVNIGDDFSHLGLHISPDLDTVCYTLAGLANPETGWGRVDETWNVQRNLGQLGQPGWFQLGDADLATHITRTALLSEGWTLSRVTHKFCTMWGISVRVLPMSDQWVQTMVMTDDGELEFQEYFVHQKCAPAVRGFRFKGIESANPSPGALEAIDASDVVIICPSNPWVSVDPILAVKGIKSELKDRLVMAVSPIIGNKAVKGPAAKMFKELGIQPSATSVAEHYQGTIHTMALDRADESQSDAIHNLGIKTYASNILMTDRADRGRLAHELIEYIVAQGR